MLKDITVKNYRLFKKLKIDNFARVNLIVGKNNSGKTSLLEAIYLLVNQGEIGSLAEILNARGEKFDHYEENSFLGCEKTQTSTLYQIGHLFGHQNGGDTPIYLASQREEFLSLKMQFRPLKEPEKNLQDLDPKQKSLNYLSLWGLDLSYSPGGNILLPASKDGSVEAKEFFRGRQGADGADIFSTKSDRPSYFLTTKSFSYWPKLAQLWDTISLTAKEDKVVEALRLINPEVERIDFKSLLTSYGGIILKIRGKNSPVPLAVMGEGMQRILSLAIAVLTAENGYLLVDEIDIGLYYMTQTNIWEFLLQIALDFNVQIFATTHSWDCICAFQEALENLEDNTVGKVLRLQWRGEHFRTVDYPGDKLGIAVRQNIEVR
jgi:ABC-type transporter Mla maintaining outer membrane lipid asymmetry ATPase subunit MlaF